MLKLGIDECFCQILSRSAEKCDQFKGTALRQIQLYIVDIIKSVHQFSVDLFCVCFFNTVSSF